VDESSRRRWSDLAAELRANLPVDEATDTYKFSDDKPTRYIADYAAMVYPFSFDVFGERAARTLDAIASASEEERDWTNWLWMISQLSSTFFYQGRADEGYAALNTSPDMTGPFMAPNEHYQRDIDDYYLPWLTTGAGAYVHSVCSMFVQVLDEDATVLLPALPGSATEARFERLMASPRVWVSGEVRGGSLVSLSAESDTARKWAFRLPQRLAEGAAFPAEAQVSGPDNHGRVTITCDLQAGVTVLLA